MTDRILLVDDDRDHCELLEATLRDVIGKDHERRIFGPGPGKR